MTNYDMIFKVVKEQIQNVRNNNLENIKKAAQMIGDAMQNDAIIQLFGWGSNYTFAMELGFRAGGLPQYHQMGFDELLLRGVYTKEEFNIPNLCNKSGVAKDLLNMYNIDSRDLFLLTELTQPTRVLLEIAQIAKANGHTIILVTNSLYPGCKESQVYELADLIIDIKVPYPDEAVKVNDNISVCPTAGILGNVVAQMMTAEIYTYLKSIGKQPGVLLSANIAGADAHNNALTSPFDGRFNS